MRNRNGLQSGSIGLSLFAITGLVGCGDGLTIGSFDDADVASDGGSDSSVIGDTVPLEDWCNLFVAARCEPAGCPFEANHPSEACIETTRELCRNETIPLVEIGIADGTVAYDATAAAACLNTISSRSCARRTERLLDHAPDCRAVFTGTKALDEDCRALGSSEGECGEGYCFRENLVCGGTCRPWVEDGQPCDVRQDLLCDPVSSFCDPQTETCRAFGAQGETCRTSAECADGLTCQRGEQAMGMCLAPKGDRETCAFSDECGSQTICIGGECRDVPLSPSEVCSLTIECPAAHVCGVQGGTMDRCLLPASRGEPCSIDDDCESGLYCPPVGMAGEGECTPRGNTGAACEAALLAGGDCAEGLWCDPDASVCGAPSEANASCDAAQPNSCAAGLDCDDVGQICLPQAAGGANCAEDVDCATFCAANGSCAFAPVECYGSDS